MLLILDLFILFLNQISILLLALFYGLFDVLSGQKLAYPFMVIGSNAIAVCMASALVNWSYSAKSLFYGLISRTQYT
jgi:predicted acyltransferase